MADKIETDQNKKSIKMVEKTFARELNYIEDVKIRTYAVEMLRLAPGYFYSAPSSSSGKYHPAYENTKGGLVLHVKAVVYFLMQFYVLDMVEFTPREKDLLIVAALLHDVKRNGNNPRCEYTQFDHPVIAADFIREYANCGIIFPDDAEFIAKAVESHMGQWNTRGKKELPLPKTSAQKLLYICDYLASRPDVDLSKYLFDGDEVPSVSEVKETKLTFGKYKGLTYQQAFEQDPGYVHWIYRKNLELKENGERTFIPIQMLKSIETILCEGEIKPAKAG